MIGKYFLFVVSQNSGATAMQCKSTNRKRWKFYFLDKYILLRKWSNTVELVLLIKITSHVIDF